MKVTYVDNLSEYYENQKDLLDDAMQWGLRVSDLKKAFRNSAPARKKKILDY